MPDYRAGKWAAQIIALQQENGLWGNFHALSVPAPQQPITTEQALRRLQILGFTRDDPAIAKALATMHGVLAGQWKMPDRREKTHDWDIFTRLMLSTWIRQFTLDDPLANHTAKQWGTIIASAFQTGAYNHAAYAAAYQETFGMHPKGGRLVDFVSFYQVSLLAGEIPQALEHAYFDYLFEHAQGIYYVYQKPIAVPPNFFVSREASRYLAAMELMAAYPNAYCKERLQPAVRWLRSNQSGGGWDMGPKANDGVYFPLSDTWRSPGARKQDCTDRIEQLIARIERSQPN